VVWMEGDNPSRLRVNRCLNQFGMGKVKGPRCKTGTWGTLQRHAGHAVLIVPGIACGVRPNHLGQRISVVVVCVIHVVVSG
jgi:hypothetical protein